MGSGFCGSRTGTSSGMSEGQKNNLLRVYRFRGSTATFLHFYMAANTHERED